MKNLFWTIVGVGIGAFITYYLLKPDIKEENEGLPLYVLKKSKGTLNDEVFAGIEMDEEETWL